MLRLLLIFVCLLTISLPSLRGRPPQPARIETTYLPNVVRVTPKVLSGGLPKGNDAFSELSKLGVRTVISVDGAIPDIQRAKKFGLRYVHLPHGYDGIPPNRLKQLAKAVWELPAPIYIHCHHGKHRSPAAAAAACIAARQLDSKLGLTVLQLAGTGHNYRGLHRSVAQARPIQHTELKFSFQFPSIAKVSVVTESMVAIERTFGNLQRLSNKNWRPSAAHPDLDAAHQALMLKEHFTELKRLAGGDSDFQRLAAKSLKSATALERNLRAAKHAAASNTLARITADCKTCHRVFRD